MVDKLPWLALRSIPGVGVVLFQRLLRAFSSPAEVFKTPEAELRRVRGMTPAIAQAIRDFRDWDRVEIQISRLTAQGIAILTQDEPNFPSRLKEIPYPPPFLFIRGRLHAPEGPVVALVGTRAASYYGLKAARRLAHELAARGVAVVSGLARGIDTAAHQGALDARGRTWAVLGCGLDVVYPPENRELYRQIAERGALVSEFPLGTLPEGKNFPRRNRIISGLSQAVVVVEAGEKSGTNWTVRFALEQGREVMAVPGPVEAPTSAGPHRLIQTGAKLVRDAEDILAELPPASLKAPAGGADGPAEPARAARPGHFELDDPIMPFLGAEPLQLEELVQLSHLPAQEVMSRLTILELQGLVRELPGKCFVLEH
ncbi:MAG: DNA-processing protein DprA [Deltaproteobacteria bacterium]|nr:DNA-processing protein DprA [Deltaproteobacteria bacterium]